MVHKIALLAGLLIALPVMAADKNKSGIDKGSAVSAFEVKDITGPNASKPPLCYVCQSGNKPVVIAFVQETSPGLVNLAKKLDKFVKENKKAEAVAFVVLLGKDSDENKKKLKDIAKEHKLEIPLTINADESTIKNYQLNKDVKNTILVYTKKKVTANFALSEIGEKDVDAVMTAAKENVKVSS